MKEWKTYKLGDLINIQSGGTPNKAISAYWGGGIPWISAKTMYVDFITDSDLHITEEGLKNGSKLAPIGSILLLTRGSGLFNRIPVCLVKEPVAYNQDIKCITVKDSSITSNTFMFFWLYSQKELLSGILETTGIGAGKIDTCRLLDINVLLPDIETQSKFIQFCSSILEKIEVNKQINDNLEQQAQALYKSWFVDFEPFKDSKFIESELGLIPEGWKVGKIKDIIRLLSGFPFKSSDFVQNGDYQLITIKGVQDGYLDVTSADKLSSFPPKMPQYCILNIGDILISLTGNVGRICIVDRNNLLLNQRVAILAPKNPRDSFYTYTMFRNELFKNELIHLARGTAQLNLSPIETGDKLAVIPPDSVLEAFAKISKGTFDQYISIKMENIRLSEMRDTLLPKLMSGELKINEIDC